jgi:hypothetical protein
LKRASIRPVTNAELIKPGSDAELDRDLVERLRTLGEPSETQDECFEPLGGIVLEAVLWLSAAAIFWAFVASHSA